MNEIETDDLDLMTNLRTTGLPMVIWVGPSYGAPHAAWIKVMQTHGQQMDLGNLAVVALQPQPHVVAGQLSAADLRLVSQWLALNEAAVLDHWKALTTASSSGSACISSRRTDRRSPSVASPTRLRFPPSPQHRRPPVPRVWAAEPGSPPSGTRRLRSTPSHSFCSGNKESDRLTASTGRVPVQEPAVRRRGGGF